MPSPPAAIEALSTRIVLLRGQRVMVDADLAALYGVSTKAFNQAIKRNQKRFPSDFLFQLSAGEKNELVTNCDHLQALKFSANRPYAFTEHGAIMAATVLRSARAVQMSVYVVRAFVHLRALASAHKSLAIKLGEIERRVTHHDQAIADLIKIVKQFTLPEPSRKRPIGFIA